MPLDSSRIELLISRLAADLPEIRGRHRDRHAFIAAFGKRADAILERASLSDHQPLTARLDELLFSFDR